MSLIKTGPLAHFDCGEDCEEPMSKAEDDGIDIAKWIKGIADDMIVFEKHEYPIYKVTKRRAAMSYVIRALANPRCKGSDEVLASIIARRQKVTDE